MLELTLLKYEIMLSWLSVCFYIVSTFLFALEISFHKKLALKRALSIAFIGLVPHSAAIIIRWLAVGHGPYMAIYEVFTSISWVSILFFLIVAIKIKGLRPIGVIVMPLCFLMMALGLFSNPELQRLPPSLRSVWLIIHILFNKVAVGSMLISFGCAVFYILKQTKPDSVLSGKISAKLTVLDDYSYKFISFGFVFWSITIAAGAIWANEAWGRYWGWDPIESWALITWLLFGIYLHLRHFHHWQGKKAAWLMIFCFISSIITLFIIPLLVKSIHSQYFS